MNPYFMQSQYGRRGPSIGGATGQEDEDIQRLRGSTSMPEAYRSKPLATLPPAQRFVPMPAGQAGAVAGTQGPAPSWAAGLQSAASSIGKGIQAAQARPQGILGDQQNPAQHQQLQGNTNVPNYDPNNPNATRPEEFIQYTPPKVEDPFGDIFGGGMGGGFGGGMGGMFGGLW